MTHLYRQYSFAPFSYPSHLSSFFLVFFFHFFPASSLSSFLYQTFMAYPSSLCFTLFYRYQIGNTKKMSNLHPYWQSNYPPPSSLLIDLVARWSERWCGAQLCIFLVLAPESKKLVLILTHEISFTPIRLIPTYFGQINLEDINRKILLHSLWKWKFDFLISGRYFQTRHQVQLCCLVLPYSLTPGIHTTQYRIPVYLTRLENFRIRKLYDSFLNLLVVPESHFLQK